MATAVATMSARSSQRRRRGPSRPPAGMKRKTRTIAKSRCVPRKIIASGGAEAANHMW